MNSDSQTGGDSKAMTHFLRCMNVDDRGVDAIDRDLDDLIEIDPYVSGTNNRRTDKDLARMLALIDSLPISENGKDGHT